MKPGLKIAAFALALLAVGGASAAAGAALHPDLPGGNTTHAPAHPAPSH